MDIEAALQRSFDRATLAVYADALQQRGDPRGELIAIDLHVAEHGATRELADKKRELVRAWLGEGPWNHRHFRFGFFDDYGTSYTSNDAYVAALARSPAAAYVRGLTLQAPELTRAQLDFVVAREHPWLRRLAIGRFSLGGVDAAWCGAVPAATPNLVELSIAGPRRRSFAGTKLRLDHPNVQKLVVRECPLVIERGMFPNVVEIAVATWEAVPFRDELPAVRTLDLTRYPLPASVPPCIVRARVRDHARAANLAAKYPHVLPQMEPRPWASDAAKSRALFVGRQEVPLLPVIDMLESCFDDMAACERAAWTELFTAWETTAGIATRALLALDHASVTTHRWEALAAVFSVLPPDAVLPIDRQR